MKEQPVCGALRPILIRQLLRKYEYRRKGVRRLPWCSNRIGR